MREMTSRERLLRALSCDQGDHVPCCFMSFSALRKRHNEDMYALCRAELAMGLDSLLFIPAAGRPRRPDHPDLRGLPVRPAPEVATREWREVDDGAREILHKEYITPAGALTTSVGLSEDWPHGDHIPFIDDYQIPRQIKPLVTEASELPALEFMLTPPSEEDEVALRREAGRAHAFVKEHGALLVGGWGVGMDMASWLCGMQRLMILAFDKPDFVEDVLEMIHQWNLKRMQLVLSAPVDLYVRRAWYEGVDFVVPDFYRNAVLPRLKREVDLAHEHGARFGYICTSGAMPLHHHHLEAGIDVLIGIDPIQGTYTEMSKVREQLAGKVATWGGVSGAVTVELGEEEEVRAAVREAMEALGPDRFVLSPVDNITVDRPQTWRNVDIFIDEWKKHR
jgi:uroporphyrinogen-III decarboxylase